MDESVFKVMIGRAGAGEEAAADYLFAASSHVLRASILKMMDPVLAKMLIEPEDILQDVHIAAWKHLEAHAGDYPSYAAFVAWLRKIAKNRVIDLHRNGVAQKNAANRRIEQGAGQATSYINLLDRIASPDRTPSSSAARREALAVLSGQMWRLPEDYRKVIQYRFVQNLPVSQVAELLDKTDGAVHMLCHRALMKLQQLMGTPSKYLSRA